MINILTHNITRWIFFIPVFVVVLIPSRVISIICLNFICQYVFTIDSFTKFMSLFVFIPMAIAIPLMFFSILCITITICPDHKIGGSIIFTLLLINTINIHVFYPPDYNSREDFFNIILDLTSLASPLLILTKRNVTTN